MGKTSKSPPGGIRNKDEMRKTKASSKTSPETKVTKEKGSDIELTRTGI